MSGFKKSDSALLCERNLLVFGHNPESMPDLIFAKQISHGVCSVDVSQINSHTGMCDVSEYFIFRKE